VTFFIDGAAFFVSGLGSTEATTISSGTIVSEARHPLVP
jgi:hypothetical protein